MKDSKRIIIILILILLFILLCIVTFMVVIIKRENNTQNREIVNTVGENINTIVNKPRTIQSVIESYDSKYISHADGTVYTILAKDLYDETGKSNEDFFIDLVNDLDEFFQNTSFYIIDEEKNIKIYAKRSLEDDSLSITINDIENYYKETNGKDYIDVEKSEIVEATNLLVSNPLLERMRMKNMYFSSIKDHLTESRELENGYTVYTNEQVKIKLSPNKAIFNLVFLEDYEDNILHNLNLKMRLSEIAELYPDYAFGGLDKEYLGYRGGNYYYFFYENQASIYPYAYRENTDFENMLTNYLETKDLDEFVKKLRTLMKSYSDIEYDSEIQRLFIAYPSRGIKVDIKDNNPKGITLYSNYCFSDKTKQLVKDGIIQYNKNDYVNEYEQMRKEAE